MRNVTNGVKFDDDDDDNDDENSDDDCRDKIIDSSLSLTVTVARSPSGTLATMIPMRKMTASSQL